MDDLISKSKLIEDLKTHFDALYREDGELLASDHICNSEDVNDLIELVNEQPTVNTWTSVKDRLPEDDERYEDRKVIDVLVSTDRGIVTKVQRISNKGYWYWGRIFSNIIAWMPLPNKYISEE